MREKSDKTRFLIIETAFKEIHQKGFRAANLNGILKKTGLTKGALYYHFTNKMELGYAVVEEYITNLTRQVWLKPLEQCDDPVESLKTMLSVAYTLENDIVRFGCPLNNMAVEMAPIDEGFRLRIERVYELWIFAITACLINGQRSGKVRDDIDAGGTATFIVASLAGIMSRAKNARSAEHLHLCIHALEKYCEMLRAKFF